MRRGHPLTKGNVVQLEATAAYDWISSRVAPRCARRWKATF